MKLLDRLLLWVLSILAVMLSLLLVVLVLAPSLSWLQVFSVRTVVGVLSGLCILSAIVLFVRRALSRQSREAALVEEGEDGSAYVTLNVINDMARRIVQEAEGVRTCKSAVKNGESGVDVELELALHPGVAVAPLAALLQKRLKDRIYEMTGIHVGKVSIMVEAAAEAKLLKQPTIHQLPEGTK